MAEEDVKPAFNEIDLSRHDFEALRADISDIVDIPRAVGQTLRWAILLPVIGTWLTWALFADRMSVWIRAPFAAAVAVGFLLAAVSIGGLVVLRSRVAETNEAADRVILMVAALHGDYLQIRAGEADLPRRELASLLATELVFPALIAGGDAAFSTMSISGPIAFLARPLLNYPLAMIEGRVLEVLGLDDPDSEPLMPAPDDSVLSDVQGSDLVAAVLLPELPPELANWYQSIHRYLSKVVGGAGTIAVGSMWTVVIAASTPVVMLLLLGWILT